MVRDPRAVLHAELRRYHADAGSPSTRMIASQLRDISVSHTTVAEALNGRRLPSWKVIDALARFLGADRDHLHDLWLAASHESQSRSTLFAPYASFVDRYKHQFAHPRAWQPLFVGHEGDATEAFEDLFVYPRLKEVPALGRDSDLLLQLAPPNLHRALLLGAAGAGKSVTAYALARRALLNNDGYVPFIVNIRDLMSSHVTVVNFIERRLSSHYQCEPPDGMVDFVCDDGRAVVVFDGLDEVSAAKLRREFSSVLGMFTARYPQCRVLVTSRDVGYADAELDSSYRRFELRPFDRAQLWSVVNKWYKTTVTDDEAATPLPRQFLDHTTHITELLENPLLLSLLWNTYRKSGYLPTRRTALLRDCLLHSFEWDRRKGIRADLDELQVFMPVLRALAFGSIDIPRAAVTERALRALANRHLSDVKADVDVAELMASRFIEFIKGPASALTVENVLPDGSSEFQFAHRAFAEYFAAEHLIALANGVPDAVITSIAPLIRKSDTWLNVAGMAVALLGERVSDAAGARAIEDLLLQSVLSRHECERVLTAAELGHSPAAGRDALRQGR